MKRKAQLTKSETQVMQCLWQLPGMTGTSSNIMALMADPKPAPTTLLTFLRILTEKGFVKTEKQGKINRFTALVSQDDVACEMVSEVKNTFFKGSFASLVSFFAQREQMSEDEIDELIAIIRSGRS